MYERGTMRYCWTTLQVRDLEESIVFYQEIVGLPVKRRFSAGPSGEIAFLGEGETQIELFESSGTPLEPGNAVTLGFATDSLDRTLAFIADRGIEIESGPFQPNDHIRFFYILDPNGVRIQFSESL